ncbi:MAG: M14 family metallopeptidase [Pyrinomonadaceae bacterium]
MVKIAGIGAVPRIYLCIVAILLFSAAFFGQEPARTVDTTTRAVERQVKGVFTFDADGVSFSNEFDGARLNKVERTGDGEFTVTILPENAPINMSPWYAFKVWSKKKKDVRVKLVYPEYARHRYDPQISYNGRKWKHLDKANITEIEKGTGTSGPSSRPKSIVMRLRVSRKPVWISAQELNNSAHVFEWIAKIARKKKAAVEDIGRSIEGRPLRMLKFGNLNSKKNILVISRQHPPEVTGYFAMQAFVNELLDGSRLSKQFRRDWAIFVVPLMNPDGVDNGQWRHNMGGVDLNRDWTTFNQPAGRQISEFLQKREADTGGKFYFGIDFHSTWNDIYYPMVPELSGNMPGLVQDWLVNIKKAIPGYEPNIQPNARLRPAIISRNYFLASHGMEAIVFEIGDNTPRDFIKKKGKVGAEELMKLMLARTE